MKKPWFDEYGWLIRKIPKRAIEECTHPGPCDADVAHWQQKLNFSVPREKAIDYLREYGAWEIEELNNMADDELAQIVLWIACGDLKHENEWLGLVH